MKETKAAAKCVQGCIGAGSRVKMFDTSLLAIENLRPGNCVWIEGRPGIVREIFTGVDQLFVVKTDSGSFLRMTGEHPMMSETGWKCVRNLRVGDKVLDEERNPVAIREIYREYTQERVYNLDIESSDYFYCEGMMVGSFLKQLEIGRI